MGTIKVNSTNVPSEQREDTVHDAVWNSVVRVDIAHEEHRPAEDIDFRMQISTIGSLMMLSAQTSPVTVNRTARQAREDTEPEIFVGLQLAGTSSVIQNGRLASVGQGEFAIYDTTTPYTLLFENGLNQHFLRIPRAALALPEASIRELTAVTLGKQNPVARFVASYFSRMAVSDELRASPLAAVLAEPTIDLLRGVLSTQLLDSKNSRPALEATLEMRILDYMTRHLPEPDLTAKRVAYAHHISIRYLYVVLARAGISPGDWIRTHRLEACRRELAVPGPPARTITAIANSWGFTDGARFSRMFKTAYGLSPKDWRAISHTA